MLLEVRWWRVGVPQGRGIRLGVATICEYASFGPGVGSAKSYASPLQVGRSDAAATVGVRPHTKVSPAGVVAAHPPAREAIATGGHPPRPPEWGLLPPSPPL